MAEKDVVFDLVKELGGEAVKAFNEYKGVAPPATGGRLPENVTGVAQLKQLKFGRYKDGDNKGKLFFYGSGVVVDPPEYAGAQTTVMIGLVNNPNSAKSKTVADQLKRVMDVIKLLGIDLKGANDPNQLQPIMNHLMQTKPHFRFHTFKSKPTEQYPDPKVTEVWDGKCAFNAPSQQKNAIEVGKNGVDHSAKETSTTTVADRGASNFDDQSDLDTLAQRAQDGDKEAWRQLRKQALSYGVSEEDFETSPTYQDVVNMMMSTPASAGTTSEEGSEGSEQEEIEEEEEEEIEEEEEWTPRVGDVVLYQGKSNPSPVPWEVTNLIVSDNGADTLQLKMVGANKVVKGVPLSKVAKSTK